MEFPLPQTIGNYRVIATLGQGGMARALLAIRQGRGGFKKLFVIKQLRPDLHEEPAFLEMFLDEARLAALLSHPNVVQTQEISEDDHECFISMEYLEGQSLARLLRRITRASVPLHLHIHIIAEVLAGLHYAHNLSDFSGAPLDVVHRDVSPGNVFVTYDGQVKLLDFGIAKAAGASFETKVGGLKGKLAYMAPEQAQAKKVDRRADIFAIGVMLWEALAERRLIEPGESDAVILNNRVNGIWQPISAVRPDAPPDLIAVCEKAMARRPADRFDDAGQFREALLGCLEHWGAAPTREAVAELVTKPFIKEREQLAAKIAEKIEAGSQFAANEPLIPRARSTTGMPLFTYESPALPATDGDLSITTQRSTSRGKAPALLIGSLALALVGVGVVLAFVLTRGEPAASTQSAAAAGAGDPAPTPDGAPPAEKTETVELFVSAAPRAAAIKLDGKPLTGNPYRGRVPLDDQVHELVVSAAKHEQSIRLVRFSRDIHVELSLSKSSGSSKSRARREAKRREALAKERARLEAEAAREKARAAAKALADAKAKAKAKAGENPKAGDSLTRPRQTDTRKIDEKNPYE